MSSRSFRDNNPGNIRHHSDGPGHPMYPVSLIFQGADDGDNYAKFPSISQGCAALAMLLATKYKDMTVGDAMAKYAPSDDGNDPQKYAKVICSWAGITTVRIIGTLAPNQFFDLCKAITRFEGWIP